MALDLGPLTMNSIKTAGDLTEALERARNIAAESRNRLVAAYPGLSNDDPRILIARHLRAAIDFAYWNSFMIQHLASPQWYANRGFPQHLITQEMVTETLDFYQTAVRQALVVNPFSLFEAGLRRILRGIAPAACRGATGSFACITRELLDHLAKDGWTFSKGPPHDLLRVWANIRNTIHNNGTFRPRAGADETVAWGGKTYRFIVEAPIGFLLWETVIGLVIDLVSLNEEIMNSQAIKRLPRIP